MIQKQYREANDLQRVQDAHMRWIKQAGDCNMIHKGDIRHRLFNGSRRYDPSTVFHWWEDETGEISGWVLLYPHWEAFDMDLAPHLRYTDFHKQMMDWTEANLIELMEADGNQPAKIIRESMNCDAQFDSMLQSRGYVKQNHTLNVTEQSLDYDIPQPQLPEGFFVRQATVDDLDNLADVHNNSFRNQWTPESYGKVFTDPGMEFEFVVVSPEGRFAAFTQVWLDDVNHNIVFEPVGTHKDFQRRGIGKAMMYSVLHEMKANYSVQTATVWHATNNPASTALYASAGFKTKYQVFEWEKSLV